MNESKKDYVIKRTSFLVNLIEGAVTVTALAISYAFIFEADEKDHDVELGVFFLLLWLMSLLLPNILFMLVGKWKVKDMAVFQFFPLLLGAVFYFVFQLFVW